MDPIFLTLDEAIAIHQDQIDRYGGSDGLRDMGLLQSALAMPRAGFGGKYAHEDLYEMAAAYLFHLATNYPFVDGNKRVAAVAADVFMALNQIQLTASEDDYASLVIDVAKGEATKQDVTTFFRSHCIDMS